MSLAISRPAPYRVFRGKPGSACLVLQVRDPETGEAVQPGDLECYITRKSMTSPWCDISFPLGSRLLLIPKTARFLLAAGTIEALEEPPLIPWRATKLSREIVAKPGG